MRRATFLSITIAMLVLMPIMCIPFVGFIAFPFAFGIAIYGMVMSIIATIQASEGKRYRYPVNWRLVK